MAASSRHSPRSPHTLASPRRCGARRPAPLSGFSYTAGGGFLFTPASPAPTVTGDGQTTPFILTADFDAVAGGIPLAHVAEQIIYANGSSTVEVVYSITNTTTDGSTLSGRFFESADLNVGGNGSGIGTFTATPIRQVGGVNPTNGRTATLFEVTPWTHYQEDANSTIQNIVNSNLATPPNLADTINPNPVDNGVAVQWDLASLAPGDNTGEGVVWNFANTTSQPPPPVPGKAVNVNVVSGQVLLKVPGGKFVPLTNATQVPVRLPARHHEGARQADLGGDQGRQDAGLRLLRRDLPDQAAVPKSRVR